MAERNPPHAAGGGKDTSLDARLAREERFLESERDDPDSPYRPGGLKPSGARRRFVLGSMAALGSAAALQSPRTRAAPPAAGEHDVPADATRVQGYPLADT